MEVYSIRNLQSQFVRLQVNYESSDWDSGSDGEGERSVINNSFRNNLGYYFEQNKTFRVT